MEVSVVDGPYNVRVSVTIQAAHQRVHVVLPLQTCTLLGDLRQAPVNGLEVGEPEKSKERDLNRGIMKADLVHHGEVGLDWRTHPRWEASGYVSGLQGYGEYVRYSTSWKGGLQLVESEDAGYGGQ